jgi:hypothetical protein
MSEEENFIARWSRRKRESGNDPETEPKTPATPEPAAPGVLDRSESAPPASPRKPEEPADPPPFDLASLPPLESIAAGTDIRAFLQSGVPAELAKAALRRAWAADPAIRDFIEIAENQWDFANPASVPGFGVIEAGTDVRNLVSQAVGKLGDETASALQAEGQVASSPTPLEPRQLEPSSSPDASGQEGTELPQDGEAPERTNEIRTAMQHDAEPVDRGRIPNRRPRGGALPQ